MIVDLNQFVPSRYCLFCHGCCRYAQKKSCWSPKMGEEEKEQVEDNQKKGDVNSPFVLQEENFLKDFVVLQSCG